MAIFRPYFHRKIVLSILSNFSREIMLTRTFYHYPCITFSKDVLYHRYHQRSRRYFHQLGTCNPHQKSYSVSNGLAMMKNGVGKECKPFEDVRLSFDEGRNLNTLDKIEFQIASRKFNLWGLGSSILERYDVRISTDGNSLIFPLTNLDKHIVAVKCLTYIEDSHGSRLEESILPRVNEAAFFGIPNVDTAHGCLVLTSNPLDVLTINQETNNIAVAFPQDVKDFPLEILPFMKKFEKVVLWFSYDHFDWNVLVGRHLGRKSYFIRSRGLLSRPLFRLQNKLCIQDSVTKASCLVHDLIPLTYKHLEEHAFEPPEIHQGVKWKKFAPLNEILKGHRRGELTIFSGHTGIGKTTFMSDYSLDLCKEGVRTLWASFEVSCTRLYETMMTQLALCPLKKNSEEYHYWNLQFRNLKLFVMNVHGQCCSVETFFEAIKLAATTYDVHHVVVDNLQFMLNIYDTSASVDLYRVQDRVFSQFRNFASEYNCHVTLVIHPKKEPEFTELNNNSISGNAKGKQEADNIIILQTTKQRQYLQVTKNRFDGSRGSFFLDFNKDTRSFSMKKKMENPPTTIDD